MPIVVARKTPKPMRNTQSICMAIHTPMTPMPIVVARKTPKPMRNTAIEKTATVIVYFASPAARSAFGIVKDIGQKITQPAPCSATICRASTVASGERLNGRVIIGLQSSIRMFSVPMQR